MRTAVFLSLPLLAAVSCKEQSVAARAASLDPVLTAAAPVPVDVRKSVVRFHSTQQTWNVGQPWEKNPPSQRSSLAAIIGSGRVIATSELVGNATNLELESTDGTRFCGAKVIAVDYEANLALLGAADEEEGKKFFEGTVPFEIADPSKPGDALQIIQVEENGNALQNIGALQSAELLDSFLPDQAFLTYRVKTSLQSAASSFSLPVLADGKFAGLLYNYSAKDQIAEVSSTDITARFLESAKGGSYGGSPSLGVATARTEDPAFRAWLKLPAEGGGLYIHGVRPHSAAESAGLKKGDVILKVDDHEIDRRGYYQHPAYGSVLWGNLVRGAKNTGDKLALALLRDGKPLDIEVTLTRTEESTRLIPGYEFEKGPEYLVKGGMVFQVLTRPLLESFDDEWKSRAPLNLLDAFENPEKYETAGVRRVVFLSGVIPTPATVGYERLRNLIVAKVNGKPVTDMKALIDAFASPADGLHSIEFADENIRVNLDENVSTLVDGQLLKRGIPRLSRVD